MDYASLSKEISYALRHGPEEYGLKPDKNGFVDVDDLVQGINARHADRPPIGGSDIEQSVALSSKQRHELYHNRIRALYGHSFGGRGDLVASTPPQVLYHGTTPRVLDAIMSEGLRPMRRQLVHMSTEFEVAAEFGARHSWEREPVVLVIDALRAQRDGIEFFEAAPQVWVTSHVPPQYLRVMEWR